jgi:hypothetical protein
MQDPNIPIQEPAPNPYFGSQPTDATPPLPTVDSSTPAQPLQTALEPTPTPKPKNKKRRRLIILAAGTLAVIITGIIVISQFIANQSVSALEAQFAKNTNYDYTQPQLNVDPTKTFDFKVNYNALQKYTDTTVTDAVEVYYDSALTEPVTDVNYNKTTRSNHIVVQPPFEALTANDSNGVPVNISTAGQWGLHDTYYIVQKLDANGKALKRPLVTVFTVKKTLETPQVSYAVDDSGVAQFKWNKISGANEYYIIQFKTDPLTHAVTDTVVGQTSDTSWASVKDEGVGTLDQNEIFKNYTNSLDDLYGNPAYAGFVSGEGVEPVEYGVVASHDNTTFSAYLPVDGATLQSQLPIKKAENAAFQQKAPSMYIQTFDQLPTQLPVTMADGSTINRTVDILTDQATAKTVKVPGGAQVSAIYVPYVIHGSLLVGWYYVEQFNPSTYASEVARIGTRNDTSQAKTGSVATYSYAGVPSRDLGKATISKTAPTVPYKINATNPLTAYIAANMIAGNQYIDVSKYMQATNHPDVYQAAYEAEYQNPYAVGAEGIYFDTGSNLVEVEYNLTKDQITAEQKSIASVASQDIAKIITAGMTDRQKALAINNFLDDTASYNYPAFDAMQQDPFSVPSDYKNSWTAAGILIDKSGVCASYAAAFKVLADAAGLNAIVVDGIAGGGPHAWDKVQMDGQWRVVDPTWDDDGTGTNGYFGLTDAQALQKDHTQGTRFMVQSVISQYAAN